MRITAPRRSSRGAGLSGTATQLPARGGPRPSEVEALFVRSLIRSQLRLAIASAAAFAVMLAVFALLLAALPELDRLSVLGVPLTWILLGGGSYPLVLTIATVFVRTAARNEERYRSLVDAEERA